MVRTSSRWRHGARFSLDDAGRIRQALQSGAAEGCPQCEFPLQATVGKDGEWDVWFVHCHGCGRGLVLRQGARTER